MSVFTRLTDVFAKSDVIEFDDEDKFIFFSDCHRGDNSWADDFAHNQLLFFHALQHYYEQGYTYIELGDGDELWENSDFDAIRRAHSHVFWLLRAFYTEGRFHFIFGNHNIQWKYTAPVQKHLSKYHNARTQQYESLFEGIKVHEGLILQHRIKGFRLFLVHGHQGDLMSDTFWRIGRFFVRNVWRQLQLLGVSDPTSPAQNFTKRKKVEQKIIQWITHYNQPTVCGHTHRSVLPEPGTTPYFNDGSCVHPRCITGIEIVTGEIKLIKWWLRPDEKGRLTVTRETLAGPHPLAHYFEKR